MKLHNIVFTLGLIFTAGAANASYVYTDLNPEGSWYDASARETKTTGGAFINRETGLTWVRGNATLGYGTQGMSRIEALDLGFRIATEKDVANLLIGRFSTIDESDYYNEEGDFIGITKLVQGYSWKVPNEEETNNYNQIMGTVGLFGDQTTTWNSGFRGWFQDDSGNWKTLYMSAQAGYTYRTRYQKTASISVRDDSISNFTNIRSYHHTPNRMYGDIFLMVKDVSAPVSLASLGLGLAALGLRRKSKKP